MRLDHPFVVVLATVSTLVCPHRCRDETRAKFNGSEVDFDSFREIFQRAYEVNGEEFNRRHLYFQNATKRHTYLNSFSTAPQSAKYGVNQFSDLSQREFRDKFLRASVDPAPLFSGVKTEGLPDKFDWRDKAVVAPVQNQQAVHDAATATDNITCMQEADFWFLKSGVNLGTTDRDKGETQPVQSIANTLKYFILLNLGKAHHSRESLYTTTLTYRSARLKCGSCWAFSVVGAMQSVHAIGSSQLVQLSVQQVLDCCFQNGGCSGGSPVRALNWLKRTRVKLVPQSEYPYKAKTEICHFFSPSHGGVALKNFTARDFSGQEEAMMGQLVEHGPLAAIVDAVSWQDYLGGIIQHHCSSQRSNHAVLIVGYNTAGDIPYWIVQNSWGTTWGNEGYVYIKIGGNVCGIADSVAAVFL